MLLLLACAPGTPSKPEPHDPAADSIPVEESAPTESTPPEETATESAPDTGTPAPADWVFDPATASGALDGHGAQVWAGDSAWTTALDPLGANLVRIALNANFGSAAVELPVDATPAEWDAWLDAHALDAAPTFLSDLEATRALTEPRGIAWLAHQWEAPPAWESGAILRADRVDDYAALWGALVDWLVTRGIEPAWIELSNEPDGDWNTYIRPEDYDALVLAVRADLDARGLDRVGIVGPGLAVLGGWSDPPQWVPTLSDEAVAALDAWSVHTWDDYAEAGEGHTFLEARWAIFLDQVRARDDAKPIFVTELGSKDVAFGAANYLSPDPSTCGSASESDGYALRLLAHTAVALASGADALLWWQAADQTWECSRWGMVDVDGRPRRFHEALETFLSALPADGQVVLAPEAELPAVAVVGAEQAVLLVVNDTPERVTRTTRVAGGWSLSEARGFGTDTRVLRDELIDLAQVAQADTGLDFDVANSSYFGGDLSRAFRTEDRDMALTWSPGGELLRAELLAWSWNGADPVSVSLEGSADGATWTPLSPSATVTDEGWHRHALVVDPFPAGQRQLRVTLPDGDGPAWTPQLGDLTLAWAVDDPPPLPSGDPPWTVDLPADTALVLVLAR